MVPGTYQYKGDLGRGKALGVLVTLLLVLCAAACGKASGAKNDYQYLEIGYGFKPVLYDISPNSNCDKDIKDRCKEAAQVSTDQFKAISDKLNANSTGFLAEVKTRAPIYNCLREGEKFADSLDETYSQPCEELLDTFAARNTNLERLKLLASCKKDLDLLECEKRNVHPVSCLSKSKEPVSQRCAVRLTSMKSKFAGKLDQDVPLMKACENEVRILCRTRTNKISCLKSKVGDPKVSTRCKKEIHRRKVEESEDIRFNKYLFSVCALDKEQHCKDVPFGQGRIVTCLEKFYGTLQAECKSAIKQQILDKQKDSTLDVRFRLLCKEDAQSLCPVEFQVLEDPFEINMGGKLKKCMRNATLAGDIKSAECKEHLLFMMEQTRRYTELDPTLVEACAQEKNMCEPHNFLECLREEVMTGNVLSQECEQALVYKDIQAAADIKLKTHMSSSCHAEHMLFCDGVDNALSPGNVISCLEDHFDHPKFGKKCRQKIKRDIAYTTRDIRMLATTYQSCQYEITELCEDVQPGGGRVVSCLKENRNKIVGGKCRGAIMRLLKISASNWKLDWSTYFDCEEDADSLCYGKRDASVHTCLRENFDFLSSKCKAKQMQLMEAESESLQVNSKLLNKCGTAVTKYCGEVADEGGKVLSCLQSYTDDPTFPRVCMKAITHHMNVTERLMPMGPKLKSDCAEDATQNCQWTNLDGQQTLDGAILKCLVSKSEVLQPKCKNTLAQRTLFLLRNFQSGNPATQVCDNDVKQLCHVPIDMFGLTEVGSIYKCLLRESEKISSECFFVLTLPKASKMMREEANVEPLYQEQAFQQYLSNIESRMRKMENSSSPGAGFMVAFLLLSLAAVGFSGYYYKSKVRGGGGVVYRELRA
ncbi:Golgi apparatus protein 1 [Chloropicon primus]|uniref:Golgi apparatus protein 1 n=1 Tax=Chloropicon primus TaxID=1764295 RepID=A0A5B8ML18_9CHLO|nr:Golgi apparatus protein 1 [Chloropicon primus]UPQ99302.1 Golgi apparatus protein 1 [Chloropicon primus]|eukprot:QDZ20090.1 Golgi apparatus protein 1 [Chloropicon primus]